MRIERIDWDGADPGALAKTLRGRVPGLDDVSEAVARVLARVRKGGDAAVRELAAEFGEPAPLRVDPDAVPPHPGC